jgi:ubiquinone biosynthesis protein COQ9
MNNEFSHLDALRGRLLAAALPRAGFEGWTDAMLAKAEADAGLPPGTRSLACPAGVVDLLDFWGRECDSGAAGSLAGLDLPGLKIRQRVRAGVLARLDAIGSANREAARRAAARLALPDVAARGARILWRAADCIWRAIGDTSTDGNHYSKRAILSGVFASTFTVWLDGDRAATEAFLDRRIENVMAFEKLKARARKARATLPDPLGALARLRFGR